MYTRLNHLNICLSYNTTLTLVQDISKDHTLPLQQWIADDNIFKFWGNNVDKRRNACDIHSNHQNNMLYMYSILVGKSCTSEKSLARTGRVASLKSLVILPTREDLVTQVNCIITQYIQGISCLSKAIPQHIIMHRYSKENVIEI